MGAFTASVAAGGVDADLSLVNDGHWSRAVSGRALLPYDAKLQAAYVMGTTLTRAKHVAPSLRQVTYPYIRPFDQAVIVPDIPAICLYPQEYTLTIRKNEEYNVETTNTAGAPEQHYAFIAATPRYEPPPPGLCYTVRLTAAITGSANQWDSGTMTPTEILPAGRYAVIGMACVGQLALAARLIPTDGGARPGCICTATIGLDDRSYFRFGRMGKWLEFEQTTLPLLELFKTGASTAQEIFLDVIKLV